MSRLSLLFFSPCRPDVSPVGWELELRVPGCSYHAVGALAVLVEAEVGGDDPATPYAPVGFASVYESYLVQL